MNRARPLEHPAKLQSVQLSVAVMSLVDHDAGDGLALTRVGNALNWQGQP
jgi:hypothetical protein